MMRRFFSMLCAAMFVLISSVPALAQSFPSKTVRILVPWPAGGSTDVLARALAHGLSQAWGQPVIIENPAGAASIIGTNKVATSPPDGYTLLLSTDPTVVANRFLFKLPFDPDKDLAPITMIARSGQFVLANPSFPAKNMKELVEAARRAPGTIAYASSGIGTTQHLMFETISKHENIKLLHVPYKGVAPVLAAAVSGEVQITAASLAASSTMVKSGRLKALAISSPQRSALFPDVPTLAESGFPYATSVIWFGLYAPGGTSPQLVQRIYHDAASVIKSPEFTEKYLNPQGLDRVADTPQEFAAAIHADVVRTGAMVKATGLQPQ
jgi:tripartite-type tricarboxylate transporter receptor subunit TctC